MSSIVNNFAENSVTMNAGSTMNGDVHIENVNQGKDEGSTTENTNDSEQKQLKSPLRLSRKKGTKIDFIRVMNAWYECGKVEDMNGNKLTKKIILTGWATCSISTCQATATTCRIRCQAV